MSIIFFTADLHLGHKNVIRLCKRPFDSIEQMDQTLIDNINRKVEPNDTLYYLGDFTLGGLAYVASYRERINCKNIHLVKGNHDRLMDKQYLQVFATVSPLKEIKACGQDITLCHYAMLRWNKSHYGAWHLYGHSHGQLPDDSTSYKIDVGVDANNYQPLVFAEVQQIMNNRFAKATRHHDIALNGELQYDEKDGF